MKVLAKARMDAQTYHLRHKAQVNASMTTRKEVLRARPFAASIAGACVRRGTLLFSRQGVVMTRAIWVIFLLSLSTSLTAAVITASSAGPKVRFTSPAPTAQIRVQILFANGDALFDSDWKDG